MFTLSFVEQKIVDTDNFIQFSEHGPKLIFMSYISQFFISSGAMRLYKHVRLLYVNKRINQSINQVPRRKELHFKYSLEHQQPSP